MHINFFFFIPGVYLLLFLLRAHSAWSMAMVKSCEIHSSLCSRLEDCFMLINGVLPSGPENPQKTWPPLYPSRSQYGRYPPLYVCHLRKKKKKKILVWEFLRGGTPTHWTAKIILSFCISENHDGKLLTNPQISYTSSDSISSPEKTQKQKKSFCLKRL